MVPVILFLLAVLSGILGRMGGSGNVNTWYGKWLNNEWRRIGCSFIVVLVCTILWGWHPLVYAAVFVFHWGAFSTYWHEFFKGEPNLWLSGFMTGVALTPIAAIDERLLWVVALRAVFLMVLWGCLNKYLPQRVFIWGRDVAEEFCRYFVSF